MSIPCCVGHLKNVIVIQTVKASLQRYEMEANIYPSLIMNTSFDAGDVLEQEIAAD